MKKKQVKIRYNFDVRIFTDLFWENSNYFLAVI